MMKKLLICLFLIAVSIAAAFFLASRTAQKPVETIGSGAQFQFSVDQRLQNRADSFLPLFDNMPPVTVYLTDSPILATGSSIERGVASTSCENPETPSIFIKKSFFEQTNEKQLANILKHELTHAWLCRQNLMSGHDENFRRKFAEVGGFGN